ncbi:mRNA-processing endoribonuclease Ecym_3132 [Eremothecium cymbalariae DBVPG|uniref:Transcriptional protein SWT1 n=1 Tax=Eremothecium cymbalariae (strain CBS 270.75 / DBVPG 7215 / KCTC 17166 / NRRL Y-17582) TaxID=931890 RepID=G8JR67_ERECY|nr:Hypothetical protein Ecym_3132 [Eremothecium cymbalariae DBVPG\
MVSHSIQSIHSEGSSDGQGRIKKQKHEGTTKDKMEGHKSNKQIHGKFIITLGAKKKNKYSLSDLDNAIEASTTTDDDGDVPMLDVDDENEIEMISDYVLNHRNHSVALDNSFAGLSRDESRMNSGNLLSSEHITIFVVDTNFILSHLYTLEVLRGLAGEYNHKILIPNTVIQELDGLKQFDKTKSIEPNGPGHSTDSISLLARRANDWIYKNLANLDSCVIGQKLRQRIDHNSVKDDAILDCCMYFKEIMKKLVILLSNDKNLCMKALAEHILTVSYRKDMTAELIASKSSSENYNWYHNAIAPSDEDEIMEHNSIVLDETVSNDPQDAQTLFSTIERMIISAIDHTMQEEYGLDLELVGYRKRNITSLVKAIKCFQKFWISVFSEYFKHTPISQNTWNSLPQELLQPATDQKSLDQLIDFWGFVLQRLYIKREETDRETLKKIIESWPSLSI